VGGARDIISHRLLLSTSMNNALLHVMSTPQSHGAVLSSCKHQLFLNEVMGMKCWHTICFLVG
jgi:hypothetical protein